MSWFFYRRGSLGIFLVNCYRSITALSVLGSPLIAEELPGFSLLRFDEDPYEYRYHANSSDPLLSIKYIPIGYAEEQYLSFGGAIRQRYDRIENPDFGEALFTVSDAWLQRYTLHMDATWNPRFRTFVQVYGGFAEGREGGPSPVDENGFELYNAFVELTPFDGTEHLFVRLGRQELNFGSGRLVSVREGPTVRRTYNAATLRYESAQWTVDSIYAVPIQPERGNFNDDVNEDQHFWGVYATRMQLPVKGSIDIYYLGFANDSAIYGEIIDLEKRHSIGLRYFGNSNQWDWNLEAIYQFGDFGEHDIQAWTFASHLGHTFEGVEWRPRIGLSTNIASGDKNPADNELGLFNAIYPRGNYFSEVAILGPRNFYNFHPSITLQPTGKLSVTFDTNFYWRLEIEDGVYGPPGGEIRGADGSNERFVAQAFSANIAYQITREMSWDIVYTHFSTGDFLKETGPSDDVNFFETTLTFKF